MDNIILPGNHFEMDTKLEYSKNFLINKKENFYISVNSGKLVEKKNNDQIYRFLPIKINYVPSKEDRIIGIVRNKFGDNYQLDMNCHKLGVLDNLAFEGATKKNKPELKNNNIVFCKIKSLSKYLAVELSCKSNTVKKNWNSGESLFGQLKDGLEIKIPPFFAAFLLKNEEFFSIIQKRIKIEVCVGINGILWIKVANLQNYTTLENFFKKAAFINYQTAKDILYSKINTLIV